MLMVGIFVVVLVSMDMDMFIPGIFGTAVPGSIEGVGVGVGVVFGVVFGMEMEGAGGEMRGVVVDTVFVRWMDGWMDGRVGAVGEGMGDILGMGMLSAIAVGIAEVGRGTGTIMSLEVAAAPEEMRDRRAQSARMGAW
jgi:hypothetical protein